MADTGYAGTEGGDFADVGGGEPGARGVDLGRLLLALDRTVATLICAPRGLDLSIADVALLDPDDLDLGVGPAARAAHLVLLVGVGDDATLEWLVGFGSLVPVAMMAKSPSHEVISRAQSLGIAVVAIDPHARWERIYNLVTRVLDGARAGGDGGAESMRAGNLGDLFGLAAEVARRTRALVSIEDERSHVLAYSTAGDEADELRRLSILGREGPPEMLNWLRQWGVMDALRGSAGVVRVDERVDLALRPRRAVAIRTAAPADTPGDFLGAIWLQQGSTELAADVDEVLVGAAAVAARIISRRRSVGSEHDESVRRLLGANGDEIDAAFLGARLDIAPDGPAVVVGFAVLDTGSTADVSAGLGATGVVSALTLHASAFSPLSVTATLGNRAYVVLPGVGTVATVEWTRAAVSAAYSQFAIGIRAVVAGPGEGLSTVPMLRAQADRVLNAARREGDLIDDVTTVAQSQTGVLLGEIVAHLAANPELIDTRVAELMARDARTGSQLTASLRAFLDHFGDVRAAASALHVHPNTLRYRLRRIREFTGMDLDDPATRLVVALSLRVR